MTENVQVDEVVFGVHAILRDILVDIDDDYQFKEDDDLERLGAKDYDFDDIHDEVVDFFKVKPFSRQEVKKHLADPGHAPLTVGWLISLVKRKLARKEMQTR